MPLRAAAAMLLAASGLALGCDDDPTDAIEDVEVTLNREVVAPGGRLEARVVNRGEEEVAYGLSYELSREVDGEFEPVPQEPRPVPQIALVTEPGETGPPVDVRIPGEAEPGEYRVTLNGAAGPAQGTPDLSARFRVEARDG